MWWAKCISNCVHPVDGMREFAGHYKEVVKIPIECWGFGRVKLPINKLKKTCSDKLGRRAIEIAGKDSRAH